MGRKREGARSLAEVFGAHLFIGLVGYVAVIFLLSAVVFPGWKPFATAGIPDHAAYGPLVIALMALLQPRLKAFFAPECTATVSAQRVPDCADRVVLELRFWSGEGNYRETVGLDEYRIALEALVRIGELGYGVQQVRVEDEIAAGTVAAAESHPDQTADPPQVDGPEELTSHVQPVADSQSLPERLLEPQPTC